MYDTTQPPPVYQPVPPVRPHYSGGQRFAIGLGAAMIMIAVFLLGAIVGDVAGRSHTAATINTPAQADDQQGTDLTGHPDTVKPDQTEAPKTTFGDGTWRVGADIVPGTYRTSGGQLCYWKRMANLTGDGILDNEFAQGQAVVTILPTDAGFESKRCGTWTKVG